MDTECLLLLLGARITRSGKGFAASLQKQVNADWDKAASPFMQHTLGKLVLLNLDAKVRSWIDHRDGHLSFRLLLFCFTIVPNSTGKSSKFFAGAGPITQEETPLSVAPRIALA